jgi:predicted dienelactone hydrolase
MKERRHMLQALALCLGLMLGSMGADAEAQTAWHVGFTPLKVPNDGELPLLGGVWYPTREPETRQRLDGFWQDVAAPGAPVAGSKRALIVMSHGGGGWFDSHYDTALALARAGFVVAAVSHAGDTYKDQSQVLKLWRRPAQLRRLVTFMLESWPAHGQLDSRHVGAFGFSNGGFTVLVAAGGVPDLRRTTGYCEAHPQHDLCRALKAAGVSPGSIVVPPHAWVADPRIKAIVVAAPAFGFTFDKAGLSSVRVPVQLWGAAEDRHQPNPWYEEAVRKALPKPPEYHVVPGADHYAFLAPCSPELAAAAPQICTDPPGFDRAAFHRSFNAEVVKFFRETLRSETDRLSGAR